jgi:hypothetical protein
MSVLKKTLAAAAALAFVSAPMAASAAPAKKLTLSSARVAAPVSAEKSNKAFSPALAGLALLAVIGGIVAASSGNSKPSSP